MFWHQLDYLKGRTVASGKTPCMLNLDETPVSRAFTTLTENHDKVQQGRDAPKASAPTDATKRNIHTCRNYCRPLWCAGSLTPSLHGERKRLQAIKKRAAARLEA